MTMERDIYMVLSSWADSVFVKTYDFFKSQGGFTESWGKNWQHEKKE